MHNDLHGNVVHHGVELLLLVSMLFLLAIPKSLLILKEFLYTSKLGNWGEPDRAPSLTSSTVALSVSVVRLFGPRGKVLV